MRGIDPRTSRMLSERTNIWATNLAEFFKSNLAEFDKNLAEFFFAKSATMKFFFLFAENLFVRNFNMQ